jgi:hypothetical protein
MVNWPIRDADLSPLPFSELVSKSALGPGGSTSKIDTFQDDHILQRPDASDLQEGRKAIVIHGEVRYSDVFGRKHWTKYRWFTGGPAGIQGPEVAVHENGNEAN